MRVHDAEHTLKFSKLIASQLQRRNVHHIGLIMCILSLCTLPYARYPLIHIGPFLPVFITAIHITYMLTAYLLFWQFRTSRELPLLILSATFFFGGCITLPHILTFPGVFTKSGWLGAGPQTAIWLWTLWHLGFPIGVLLYIWSTYVYKKSAQRNKAYYLLPYLLYIGVILLVIGMVVFTTRFHDLLPPLIGLDGDGIFHLWGVDFILLLCNITAFVFTLLLSRTKTILHVWLALSVFIFLLDIILTLFAGNRYTLGWYASRADSLLSVMVVLSTFVHETNRLYAFLFEREQRYKSLFEQHPDAVYSLDLERHFVGLNPACETLTGYTRHELKQGSANLIIVEEEKKRSLLYFEQAKQGISQNYDTVVVHKDGHLIDVNITNIPIIIENKIIGVYGIMRDISEQKRAHRLLRELSFTDGLTGLANRRYLDGYLKKSWELGIEQSIPLSIILFDIDFFKRYNDYYGHQAGDNCLQLVAKVVEQSVIHSTDLAARYGGEEFCITLPYTSQENALIVAERIRRNVESLQIQHARSEAADVVTISMGVASMIPHLFSSIEELLTQADRALYQAKQQGRNQVISYTSEASHSES